MKYGLICCHCKTVNYPILNNGMLCYDCQKCGLKQSFPEKFWDKVMPDFLPPVENEVTNDDPNS